MQHEIFTSGIRSLALDKRLLHYLETAKPKALGVASAFVSMAGIQRLTELVTQSGIAECKIVAGLDNAITHPAALQHALANGWDLRLGQGLEGIFHPKLLVGGGAFSENGMLSDISFLYVGSSNLTMGGFRKNVECGLLAGAGAIPESAKSAFSDIWQMSTAATDDELRNYGAVFADRCRQRSLAELVNLGVHDERPVEKDEKSLRASRPTARPILDEQFAVAAWAGLQSFTGDYQLQIEFPKIAAKVILGLIGGKMGGGGIVDVFCPTSQKTRKMTYKFYTHNGMFRLNIPNEVPGVDWARTNKDGIAIVEKGLPGGAAIRLRLLRPGAEADEIIGKSALLGTWGKTSTRVYGWY